MDISGSAGLRDPEAALRRREAWASSPSLATLRDFVGDLSIRGRCVPGVDPEDAGADARVLLVLESPGPRSTSGAGTGVISVDNPDQTAKNCWNARQAAGLIEGVMQWNMVPWELDGGRRKPSEVELAEGAIQLRHMLDLLPEVVVIVLCGDYARRGWRRYTSALIDGPGPVVIETHHPSAQGLVRAGRRAQFSTAIRHAAALANA